MRVQKRLWRSWPQNVGGGASSFIRRDCTKNTTFIVGVAGAVDGKRGPGFDIENRRILDSIFRFLDIEKSKNREAKPVSPGFAGETVTSLSI